MVKVVARGTGTPWQRLRRPEVLTTATKEVDNEEGRRRDRMKMADLDLNRNHNRTPDQDRDQSLYWIPTDLPPIILPNPNPHRPRLVRQHVGMGGGPTQASCRMGGRCTYKYGVGQRGYNKLIEATLDVRNLKVVIGGVGNYKFAKVGGKGCLCRRRRQVRGQMRLREGINQQRGSAEAGASSAVGVDPVLIFLMPARTGGTAYSGRGGGKKGS